MGGGGISRPGVGEGTPVPGRVSQSQMAVLPQSQAGLSCSIELFPFLFVEFFFKYWSLSFNKYRHEQCTYGNKEIHQKFNICQLPISTCVTNVQILSAR